jgi:phosphomannomutase
LDQLAILSDRFGHYATGQISIRVTDLSLIAKQMNVLRENPLTEIDGVSAEFTDLSIATANLGATDALRFDLADSRRVIIRPSGTEPKLKCYLQAIGETKESAVESLAALNKAMSQLIK